MPVNLEWDVQHELDSPLGILPFNEPGDFLSDGFNQALYLLKPKPYTILPPRFRQVTDDLSQADGMSLQPPYISGLVADLYVEFWVAPNGNLEAISPACLNLLQEMEFMLTLHLNALRKQGATPDGTQRLLWQPTGYVTRRMLTQILLAGWPTPVFFGEDGMGAGVTFSVATPFPYAVDENADGYPLTDGGGPTFVGNNGNADYSPVINVNGPLSTFAITRVDTGEVVSYGPPGDAIPSGQHLEIDFFTANAGLVGVDEIAGFDPTVTTFFMIPPGGCDLEISGADAQVLIRNPVL